MTVANIDPVVTAGFSLVPSQDPRGIVVRFSGTGDMGASAPLIAFLKQLHTEACRVGIREVVIDICNLDFMNSSCFKCFVWWISIVGDMDDVERYRVRFVSNPGLHWQRRSLEALESFAPEVVVVVNDPTAA